MQALQALALRAAMLASGPRRRGTAGLALRLGGRLFALRRAADLRSRMIGLGIRREHVQPA
jgi:hypothetical protein